MPSNKVRVTVVKHLPYGLKVQLEDGRKGIIREREVSWDAKKRQCWKQEFPVAWEGKAVILKQAGVGEFELSLRLADDDPWENISDRFQPMKTVAGVVTSVVPYGVFIEIARGVTGLLHASQMPPWVNKTPSELFWPGDHVRVQLLKVDPKQRRISLGLPLINKPDASESAHFPDIVPAEKSQELTNLASRLDQFMRLPDAPGSVIVVDDDLRQADLLGDWMSKIGMRITLAASGEEALQVIEQDEPDIALVDLVLPGISGIQVIQEIRQSWPDINCVLITDWSQSEAYGREIDALSLEGIGLILKPLLPEDLLDWLVRITEGKAQQHKVDGNNLTSLKSPLRISSQVDLPKAIQPYLEQLRVQTGFEACFLFSLDAATRSVEVVQRSGGYQPEPRLIPSLVYSPVRDAAEDGDEIVLERIADRFLPRYRYLMEIFPLQACLGVKVPASVARKYALFLLDTQPKRILPEMIFYTNGAALAVGALLEKYELREQAVLLQRNALLGNLTRGLVHEVNHQLSDLNVGVYSLKTDLKAVERDRLDCNGLGSRIEKSFQDLTILEKTVQSLTSTTKQFGYILARPKNELLRVDELVEETLRLLRDTSDHAKIKLYWTPPKELLVVRSQGTALQQVLINVMLNGIQQLQESCPGRSGWVQIQIEAQKPGQEHRVLRIIIEDNGPGIHFRNWEAIFEPGYTTRSEGSGMGLYISRSLMEAMRGKLLVERSEILFGSVFTIEIPWEI